MENINAVQVLVESVKLHSPNLECMNDVLNPCYLSNSFGKHWGGGKACPTCVVRQIEEAKACAEILAN